MYKRILGIGIFLCAISFSIFAGGRKDNESHEAENPAGFTNSIDIDNKKPGKYNFYIEAKDTAGNAALAGPDNIYIDPASDLPVVKIINPADNMHVQGNLKIVGVCVDDDGVDYVEFIINKGKDGKGEEMLRSRAEGNSFWSYFLDTSDTEKWTDGTYTISAWAVDINGLSGISEDFPPKVHKIHRVIWNLDRKKPETMVTSHEDGIIVTGKINLKGTVTDGNGIQSLEYSLDEGENYLPVKIKYDKKQDIYSWSLPIDTRKIEDGARVIWFKAVDGLGTMEMSAHLFFINNIGADIKIVYPEPGEPVNGLFTVAGYASHPVGLSAIQWKLGKESGEIPMVIGNPWWVQEFDLRGQKLSSAVLEITAIDYSGNKTVRKHQFKVNQNADLPVISLQEPFAKGAVTDNNALKIIGTASDNDGVASIFYSIDAQPAVEIPCTTGYFQFTVPDLAPGSHSLDIWAKDITGVEGNKITIKGIVNAGGSSGSVVGANSPSLNSLAVPDGKWVQNTLSIQASNVRLSEYSLDLGATWRRLTASETEGGGQEFTMNISDMEDGLIQISVRTADQSVKSFKVLKDTAAPVAQLIVPYSEARVNGTIRLGIAVKEAGSLQKVSYVLPAVEEEGGERQEIIAGIEPGKFIDILLDSEKPLDETMAIIFEDAAGNRSELKDWHFIIDEETDIPVVYIILPMENEIITNDFIVSGVMYDDDKIKQIYWRIDDDEEQVLEADNAFSIPVSLASLNDNEHTITVIAEDVFGVKSGPVDRTFRVSLAEPTVAVLLPELNTIVKETVLIAGTAADKNGISKIQVSLDNGNTFNDAKILEGAAAPDAEEGEGAGAEGSEITETIQWEYQYNSKIFKDGTNVVFVRAYDAYGISAMYSSLVNIDNTAPEIVVDSPADGIITTGKVYITGRTVDLNMDNIAIELRSLSDTAVPDHLKTRKLEPAPMLMETMDLSELEDGIYNIEIWAIDKAENITRVSRNIELARETRLNFVDILYPLEGEYLQGSFNLYGYAGGMDAIETVAITVNGRQIDTAEISEGGYFRFPLSGEQLAAGQNEIIVSGNFSGSGTVQSPLRSLSYNPVGAWVTIDSLNIGDFAFERPWFTGRAGYALSEEDEAILADKKAKTAAKNEVRAKTLDYTDISFDNGSTFLKISKSRDKESDWRYRLETGEMTEGIHYIIVRANMKNGDAAITRTLVQVDKTPPYIRLISPEANGRYNQELMYTAMASDDVGLSSMTYHLRKGDKMAYEIPGFIKGLYFEFTLPPFIKQIFKKSSGVFGGATYMDFNLGLSFFDDNVKVQIGYGFMTQKIFDSMYEDKDDMRYGGHVLGLKLLANIYTLPFGAMIGPDWEWLSASFALGANFSLFSVAQSGNPTWMSAILAQIEFPKVTIPKRSNLRTFSLFTEGQLWFIPTDVNAKANDIKVVIPHIVLGLRMYIF